MTRPGITSDPLQAADPSAPALLTIDLGALTDNYRTLAAHAPSAECAAVVKADAYGIGAAQAIPALAVAGCRTFFVATVGEAKAARRCAPDADIYVLDGLFPGAAAPYGDDALRPVLGGIEEIREWAEFCRNTGKSLPAAIHIDTGMNRLGLRAEDVETLAQDPALLETFLPALVMSHLACADDPANPMNETQRAIFETLRARLPAMPASLANSPGILLGETFHYDMIRPGISLYGGRAAGNEPAAMKPVVSLHARIAQLRTAQTGESVGYGAATTLSRETRVATVMTGYADGIFRNLGASEGKSGLTAYIDDHAAPILGRVSMDMITLDVTDVPAGLARRGTFVELIGRHTSVDDMADKSGTLGYEVLTSLGRRYQRVYTGLESDI